MRGNKIMGFLWIIIAVCLTIILVVKINGKNTKGFFRLTSNVADTKDLATTSDILTFEASEVKEIDTDLASESIVMEKSDSDKIIVELQCAENNKPTVALYDNVLKIEANHKPLNIHFGSQKVIIRVPENTKFQDVDLSTASGSVNVSSLCLNTVDCNSASGSVNVSGCTIAILDAKSASGSVNIENCVIETVDCDSKSGSVNLSGSYDKFEAKSISGSVNVRLDNPFTQDSELQSTSGSIRIKVPADSNFQTKYSVTSGNYKNELSGTSGKKGKDQVGNGGPTLELHAISGSIHVSK